MVLRRLAGRFPRAAIGLAGALAWTTQPLGRGVASERIAAILPNLSRGELDAARRATWASSLRSRALAAAFVAPGGRPVYPRVVADEPPSDIAAPLVLVSFHIGALFAIGATLERLPGEVLLLHDSTFPVRPGVTLLRVGGDEWARAAAFRQAITTLRSGGFVFLTVDYSSGATVPATMLGRPISLARGGFALARMTGTRLLPLAARWRGTGVEIHWGDPIEPSNDEAMAAAVAAWLERHVLAHPGDISPVLLDLFDGPP